MASPRREGSRFSRSSSPVLVSLIIYSSHTDKELVLAKLTARELVPVRAELEESIVENLAKTL